jgi:GT2 family glycosyltransferase
MTDDLTTKPKLIVEIKNNPFTRSRVDIIIPFHGQYDKVSRLIYSIVMAVKSNPYQITLVDDASPNKDFVTLFKDFDNKRPQGTDPILKFIRNEKRLGFAQSLQVGFNATKQPWVMFMHSDCIVEDPQWMLEMGKSLLTLRDKKVKMVSARCQKRVAGVTPHIEGKKGERVADFILQDGFLPLFCVMCHRDLFRHIGGFIKPYTTYEDQELGNRMNYYGYKQAICGGSFVHHDGGSTYNALIKENPAILEEMETSRDRAIHDLQLLTR